MDTGATQCDLCQRPARAHCESDQASLCWACDARVHGANFLVARHVRRLLCRSCQSPTPWRAEGAMLGPTFSVCDRCFAVHSGGGGSRSGGATEVEARRRDEDEDEREDEDEDEDEDGDEDEQEPEEGEAAEEEKEAEAEEEEEEEELEEDVDGDNQVVPWTSTSTPPPPSPAASSPSSSGGEDAVPTGGNGVEVLEADEGGR